MKEFMYNAPEREAEIKLIQKLQKQKIAKQQIIFIAIFFVIVACFIYYIGYKQYYLEFPGNVHVNLHKVRASEDLIVFDMNKELGDIVVPGDTVFSYMFLSYLIEQENVNKEADVMTSYRKAELKHEEAVNAKSVTETMILELKKAISEEENNIRLGLSDNSHKIELERKLRESEAILRAQNKTLLILRQQLYDVYLALERSGVRDSNTQVQYLTRLHKRDLNKDVIRYYVVQDSAVVTHMAAARRSRVFRGEEIMFMQPLDATSSQIYISAYVPFEDVKFCTRDTPAELVINSEISLEGYVAVQGTSAIKLPPNLQSNFTRKIRVNQTIFKLKPGQIIPFWCLSEGTPVTVRIRRTDVNKHASTKINIRT